MFVLLRIHWRLVSGKVICCSTPRLSGYFIYSEFTSVFFKWMLFRLVKEINRLIGKEMSNIYLKFREEPKFSKFRFSSLKVSSPMSAFGKLQLTQISLDFKTWCKLKIRGLGEKFEWLFYYFNFARNYGVLMPKSPSFCRIKVSALIKTKLNSHF